MQTDGEREETLLMNICSGADFLFSAGSKLVDWLLHAAAAQRRQQSVSHVRRRRNIPVCI